MNNNPNKIIVGVIQLNIEWENLEANFNLVKYYIEKYHTKNIDLFVLPEMFLTGFTFNKEVALDYDSIFFNELLNLTYKFKISLMGSLLFEEDNKLYNRLFYLSNGKVIDYYDKKHLFTLSEENKFLTPGSEQKIFLLDSFKIFPIICYDLRFPIWCRNKNYRYDILVVSANWPEARIDAWDKLLVARAIENQCYVLASNRTGFDKNGNYYNGHSCIIDFNGNIINSLLNKEGIAIEELNFSKLFDFRKKYPFVIDDTE